MLSKPRVPDLDEQYRQAQIADGFIKATLVRAKVRRRIEVDPFCQYARDAAKVLVLMGAADEVYPSFLVPPPAVWSLNGEPMLPPNDGHDRRGGEGVRSE